MSPSLPHGGMLTDSILCGSCAGNDICCELICAKVLSCSQDIVYLRSSWPLPLTIFLLFIPRRSLSPGEEVWYKCPISEWALYRLLSSSVRPVVSFCISHHQPLIRSENCDNLWIDTDLEEVWYCLLSSIIVVRSPLGVVSSPTTAS